MASVWETLSKVDVSDHTEDKNGLTYLSWAWAWGIVKKHYPNATFRKNLYGSENSMIPYMVDPAGYAFVSVTVTIEGEEQTEVLPVLNHANKAVSAWLRADRGASCSQPCQQSRVGTGQLSGEHCVAALPC